MRVRNVDKNWDWTFGQSQSNYVRNQEAVVLDIKMKLKEFYKDCFFALQNGIPWRTRLGAKNQKDASDKDIIKTVKSVEGVLNISDFESSVDARHYRAKFSIYTQYSIEAQTLEFSTEDFING